MTQQLITKIVVKILIKNISYFFLSFLYKMHVSDILV